tara:strand:+ start:1339 stop:1938 length:600 start_codon:yes stop_codon:yes gene_type:complete
MLILFDITNWWETKELFEQFFWATALISSVIFTVMFTLALAGGDGDSDLSDDLDIDGDVIGFHFFTLKNIIGFFVLFGWTGIVCISAGYSTILTLIISVIAGNIMMLVMATIFYFLMQMTDSGTLDMNNALYSEGKVYLAINKNREREGKVQITIQNGLRTLRAITDDNEDISTGTRVEVLDIIDDDILLVTKNLKQNL